MDRLAVYQFRELESTEWFGERIFWTNHFNEQILEIQFSKKNCRSHHWKTPDTGGHPQIKLILRSEDKSPLLNWALLPSVNVSESRVECDRMCLFLPNTWICTDCLLHNWLIFYVISWGTEAWRWPGHVLLEVRLSKTWKGGRLFIVLNRRFVLCRSVELIVDSTVETLTFPSWSIWPDWTTELRLPSCCGFILQPVTLSVLSHIQTALLCCCIWCVVVSGVSL